MKTLAESQQEINTLVTQWETLCLSARSAEEFACLMGILGAMESMFKASLSAVIEPPATYEAPPSYHCEHLAPTGEVVYGIATLDPQFPDKAWYHPEGTSSRHGYWVARSTVVCCGIVTAE